MKTLRDQEVIDAYEKAKTEWAGWEKCIDFTSFRLGYFECKSANTAEDLLQSQKVTKPVTNDDCDKHPCPECEREMYSYITENKKHWICKNPTCGGKE